MFEYLKGTLIETSPQKIILDVGGIGYGLFISIATFENLPQIGSEVKIFTSSVIREDSHKLFGFLTREEKDFFSTLCEISGIGPRLSITILGHMTLKDLHLAVKHHNVKAILKIPGIGKKMAERLILELRDKFEKDSKEKVSLTSSAARGPISDAISALVNLGYNPIEAQKAVQSIVTSKGEEPPLSELISLALKAKKG